jgi:hypothetical protein
MDAWVSATEVGQSYNNEKTKLGEYHSLRSSDESSRERKGRPGHTFPECYTCILIRECRQCRNLGTVESWAAYG